VNQWSVAGLEAPQSFVDRAEGISPKTQKKSSLIHSSSTFQLLSQLTSRVSSSSISLCFNTNKKNWAERGSTSAKKKSNEKVSKRKYFPKGIEKSVDVSDSW
jgi:hypothetical protein